ncbi:MAG: GTP-binding protein [Cyanobacteria bacterium SW_9_44_58]|nr:MAG: GTP-binding protein [Cyanobacteria bacterium SW_9_44_58]
MPSPRLLLFILTISVVLALMIWLVSAIYQLYIQIAFTAPILANLLLLLLMGLIVLIIGFVIYYFQGGFKRKGKKKKKKSYANVKAPAEKNEAAQANLQAVREQVEQIQDEVAQQALLEKSQALEANFNREAFQVVIFGTVSAGKTSLVNALMGRVVGEVSAPMGTTQAGETYRLQLPGLEQQILVTDTPGILEAGVLGTEREKLARELATEADLLLFLVDNDLRQSEYEPLSVLAEIGKRSLLVFNKTDLYTEQDQDSILEQLRSRTQNYIAAHDVLAVAANPSPFHTNNGDTVQPEPDIMPLIKRLAAVLRAEGADLIADNILLQSQRLGEEARRLIDSQRRRQADKIIERYQWIGAGVIAVTPLPVVDMLGTAAVNTQMVVEIGRVYGCEINFDRGRELALSVGRTLVSLGVVKGVVEIVSTALQFTVATYVVGKAVQGVSAAYLTRIAGKSFIEYFRQDQDWGDGGMTEVVKRQFQLNRRDEFVKSFIGEAMEKVVEPLMNKEEEDSEEQAEQEYDYNQQGDDWHNPPQPNLEKW